MINTHLNTFSYTLTKPIQFTFSSITHAFRYDFVHSVIIAENKKSTLGLLQSDNIKLQAAILV